MENTCFSEVSVGLISEYIFLNSERLVVAFVSVKKISKAFIVFDSFY